MTSSTKVLIVTNGTDPEFFSLFGEDIFERDTAILVAKGLNLIKTEEVKVTAWAVELRDGIFECQYCEFTTEAWEDVSGNMDPSCPNCLDVTVGQAHDDGLDGFYS